MPRRNNATTSPPGVILVSFVRTPARLVAAAAVGALALTAWTPGSAAADGLDGVTGATGLVRPVADTASTVVLQKDGVVRHVAAQMLAMQTGPQSVVGYTLDPSSTAKSGARYSDSVAPGALDSNELGKINWLLQNTVPQASSVTNTSSLPKVAGRDVLAMNTPLTPRQRAAATQAAIWHYAAGTDLVRGLNAGPVEALYKTLTGAANVGRPVKAPKLMSALGTDALGNLRGGPGQLIGPFTVDKGAGSVLTNITKGPAGVKLVNPSGQVVKSARGGEKFFLDVPKNTPPGEAVVTAVGDPASALGRVVQGVTSGQPGQGLVFADRKSVPVRQSSVVRWGADGLDKDLDVSPTCVADGIGVDLDNTKRRTPLYATVDGRKVTVPAGASKIIPIQVPEGALYDIPVSDGLKTINLKGKRDCADAVDPGVTTQPNCADGGMDVIIANDRTAKAGRNSVYTVNGQKVPVEKLATATKLVPVAEGASYVIEVLGPEGFSRRFAGVRDCAAKTKLLAAKVKNENGGGLPITGAGVGGAVAAGIALLGAGALVRFLVRRRRAA